MLAPEPASFTATAAITASSNAPAAAISAPPRNLRLAVAGEREPSRRPGAFQRRVVDQDRLFELLQGAPGLESELVEELAPSVPVGLQRVGLPAGSVQREHQLAAQALAQRMLAHQRLELAHQPGMLARGQIRVDPVLERGQTGFLQPRDLRLGKRLVGEVRERRTAPHPQRLPQNAPPRSAHRRARAPPGPRATSVSNRSTSTWPRLGLQQVAAGPA